MYLYDNKDKFQEFLDNFSNSKNDKIISDIIKTLYNYYESYPYPESAFNDFNNFYDSNNFLDTGIGKYIIEEIKKGIDFLNDLIKNIEEFIKNDEELYYKFSGVVYSDSLLLTNLNLCLFSNDWDTIYENFNNIKFARMPAVKGEDKLNPDIITFKNLREDFKSNLKEIASLIYIDSEKAFEEFFYNSVIRKQIIEITDYYSNALLEIKREKNSYDFSDIEHMALALLYDKNEKTGEITFSERSKEIASMFDQVMVDEYQDTNLVQDMIFSAVSNNNKNIFVVGDVKQSIYSFRQANPEIFIRRKENTENYSSEIDNYPSKIILSKNFRSRKEILESINFIFRKLMSKEVGGIEYNEEEQLNFGLKSYNESSNTRIKVDFIDGDYFEDENSDITEIRHIAKNIYEYMATGEVFEDGKNRKPTFGDFAIIMRNAKGRANIFVKELERMGIPAVSSQSDSFLNSYEVALAINFLKVIDNPTEDIPLISIMISPVYGFSPDELSEMRTLERKNNYYSAVKISADKGNKKAKAFLNDIKFYRQIAVNESVDNLLTEIYEQSPLVSVLTVLEGEKAKDNLYLLREYARSFSEKTEK
ncbi:MAG: UvrD-helicase domain-containing protein, partial [Acutalibacteraceae bacterium]